LLAAVVGSGIMGELARPKARIESVLRTEPLLVTSTLARIERARADDGRKSGLPTDGCLMPDHRDCRPHR
jgi:hypothetical protein